RPNRRSIRLGSRPGPSSATCTMTASPARVAATSTRPSGAPYFSAFEMRLRRISSIEASSPVTGDDASIELILRNLISNALKYGAPDGLVEVAATRAGDAVMVQVAEDGPGLEPSRIERRFGR